MGIPVRSPRWKVASAFLLSKKHIDVLVAARWPEMPGGTNDRPLDARKHGHDAVVFPQMTNNDVGRMLWLENIRSMNAAYPKHPIDEEIAKSYRFSKPAIKITHVVVIKAIHSYEYQSCEHDGWASSKAKEYCDELADHMVHNLPGYDEAPWSI